MREQGWYITAAFVGLLADQLAKWAAVTVLPPGGATKSWGAGFGLSSYINNQFAWSWPVSNNIVIIFTILLLVLGGFFYFQRRRAYPAISPIFLIAAGAVSNLIDRIFRGGVVDYFLVPGGGVINLADILIFIGIGLLIMRIKSN